MVKYPGSASHWGRRWEVGGATPRARGKQSPFHASIPEPEAHTCAKAVAREAYDCMFGKSERKSRSLHVREAEAEKYETD